MAVQVNAVQCGPGGATGDILSVALARLASGDGQLPMRTGVVEFVDEDGYPPIIKVSGRYMRYFDNAGTIAAGDIVQWFDNGYGPTVMGKLARTPLVPSSATTEWFETGNGAADHPAIGLRVFQGTTDPNGRYEFEGGYVADDVLVAIASGAEWGSLSRQWHRHIWVTDTGQVRVYGMQPGRRFRVLLIVKNDSPPGGTPQFRYVATGQNASGPIEHPLFAVATQTGTLDSSGSRPAGSLPSGVTAANTLMVHARAIDSSGRSIDVSRYSPSNWSASRAHPDGQIEGRNRQDIANRPYVMTWVYSTANRHDPNGSDSVVDHVGDESKGQRSPLLVTRHVASGALSGGRRQTATGIDDAGRRVAAISGVVPATGRSVAAEMYSESANVWEFAEPNQSQNGQTAEGLAFVLAGADTASDV